MLKRVNWKFVFKCFGWTVGLVGIVTLMSFVEVKKHTVTCTNIKILIPGADNFIEREEIDAILKQSQGTLVGRNLENINLHAIEQKIVANPYIAQSKVYADMDGVIHIEISQRQPLLRIINTFGQDYYIDRDGLKMPVSPNFTADVVVANGHIMEHFGGKVDTLLTKMASDLYRTAIFLKKDTLWDSQIEQIFVNDKDDIELVPRVGNQRIILGSADSLEKKMTNLLIFYKKAMPQVGWDTYKTINIKYTNQIVCERNKIDSINGKPVQHAVSKPTVASSRKVLDSIVKAQIAAELRNNPRGADDVDADVPEREEIVVAAKKAEPVKKAVIVKKAEPVIKKAPEKKKEVVKKTETVKKVVAPVKKAETTKKTETVKKADPVKKKEPEVKKKVAEVKKETVKKTVVTVKKAEPVKKKEPEAKKAEAVKAPVRKSWPPHAKEPVKVTSTSTIKKDTKKNK